MLSIITKSAFLKLQLGALPLEAQDMYIQGAVNISAYKKE